MDARIWRRFLYLTGLADHGFPNIFIEINGKLRDEVPLGR